MRPKLAQNWFDDARARWAIALLILILVYAVLGPIIAPFHAEFTDWQHTSRPPQVSLSNFSIHWFGTDAIGRDIFVRTAVAARLSILIGLLAAACALCIGLVYGALAGFWGGWRERVMMRALDVISALPFLLIVILLLTLFGRSLFLLLLAIGGFVWFDLARVTRAEAARVRHLAFIDAARLMGASDFWLVRKHILPNLANVAIVYASVLVPQAILVESFLSFLGLSIDQPSVSLGSLLFDGTQEMQDAPWSLYLPASFFILLLLALNLFSDALRDYFDPRANSA